MKKTIRQITTLVLVFIFIFSCIWMMPKNVNAAKKYTIKKISNDKTINGEKSSIDVKCSYKYVQLKGGGKAKKKINKDLKPRKSWVYDSDVIETAKNDADCETQDTTYLDCTEQTVSYYGKKYVSIYSKSEWAEGGVLNTYIGGSVYNLKTGKRVKKLTAVTKEKSLAKIKEELIRQIHEKDEGYDTSEIGDMKDSDFKFYIRKDGMICVCFGPYDLGFGGWTKRFYIEGDVK